MLKANSSCAVIVNLRCIIVMAEAQRTTLVVHAIVKGYHECPFEVELGDKFSLTRKLGDRGRALKVTDGRGQLGHIQKELVEPLWPILSA